MIVATKKEDDYYLTWNISLINGQAAELPPGINDGPYRAPSSPPETPDPT